MLNFHYMDWKQITRYLPLEFSSFFLFMLKGFAAFSLWMEKDLAINLAIADAILGIVVCGAVMFIIPFLAENLSYKFSFRLELALLIPYLLKLQKIKPSW